MHRSAVARHLRTKSRRVVPARRDRPSGVDALVSPSYGWRSDRKWQAHVQSREADEVRRRARLAEMRASGGFDRLRRRDLGDIADAYEAELGSVH